MPNIKTRIIYKLIFSFKKINEIITENIGIDNINVVYSGKGIFFKAIKPKKGKGANNNPLNKGIK